MAKTLYIHIGHYKTGTTALQQFLWDNREELAADGIDYPAAGCAGHKHNAFAVPLVFGQHKFEALFGHKDPMPPEAYWEKLYAHIAASEHPNTLISSEEFICVGEEEARIDRLRQVIGMADAGLKFKIICYLRAPGAHLESWYNQLVKLDRPIGPRAHGIARGYDRINVDYALAVRPWVEIFGAPNVILRSYDPTWRKGTELYEDFYNLLPAEYPIEPVFPQKDANPKMDDRALELVRILNRVGAPREAIDAHRKRFAGWMAKHKKTHPVGEAEMAAARDASLAGLDWLETLPRSNLKLDRFREDPPRLRPHWEDLSGAVLEYALSELLRLEKARDEAEAEPKTEAEADR